MKNHDKECELGELYCELCWIKENQKGKSDV